MPATVQTVTGPVEPARLGVTYMHEHVIAATPGLYTNYPHLWDRARVLEEAVARLQRIKAKGVDTLVDMSPADFQRDPELVREASLRSGVQIVHATGAYHHTTLFFEYQSVETLVELFVRDIQVGMNDTDVRAGILKCATGAAGVTPGNRKLIQAVARAHRATGVPISTHTDMASRNGLDQQQALREEGVDLGRVVIGHSNDVADIPYLEQIIENGSYVGMDRFGLDLLCPEEQRIDLLVEMCRRGYADRIVLSHDASVLADFVPPRFRQQEHWHWETLVDRILPQARERGVTEEQIRMMTVENPRRIFEAQAPY